MCVFDEGERRERQINKEYDPLIRQEREAEIEGKRMLKMHEWRNDKHVATEVARAGAEVARLKRTRDRKLQEVWKEWKDIWASNNGDEAERRERQINEEYNPLIQQERKAEIEGKRMLKMHEWRNNKYLTTEVARAGAEVARLKRIRDRKLEEV